MATVPLRNVAMEVVSQIHNELEALSGELRECGPDERRDKLLKWVNSSRHRLAQVPPAYSL